MIECDRMDRTFTDNNFDLLRIAAATQVVITHAAAHLKLPDNLFIHISSFFLGVPMFFVISGFLISASFERSRDTGSYFIKRALRIFPALWTCVIVTIPVIFLVGHIDFVRWETLTWLFSQFAGVIYTPTFLKGYGFGSYNGSLWTIPIELQFYALVPILYTTGSTIANLVNVRNKPKVITSLVAILFIVFAVAAYFFAETYTVAETGGETRIQKLVRYSFVPHFYLFLGGVLLQRISAFRLSMIVGKGLWWTIAFIAISFVIPQTSFFSIVSKILLGITTISLAYTRVGLAKRVLRGTDISYGIYIYHGLIIGVFVEWGLVGNYGYGFAVFFVSCILGWLSWTYLESPILKLKRAKAPPVPTVEAMMP